MKKTYLVFKSDPDNLKLAQEWLNEISLQFDIDKSLYPNILISLTEAVNNAIFHGNKCDKDKNIRLTFQPKSNCIKFKICDEGEGFDNSLIPDPTADINLLHESGRGVLLMKYLAHKVKFKHQGSNVEITFKTKCKENEKR